TPSPHPGMDGYWPSGDSLHTLLTLFQREVLIDVPEAQVARQARPKLDRLLSIAKSMTDTSVTFDTPEGNHFPPFTGSPLRHSRMYQVISPSVLRPITEAITEQSTHVLSLVDGIGGSNESEWSDEGECRGMPYDPYREDYYHYE
ncbi:hypothetical protein KIPB_013332, partial [Kipferlia bialata]